MATLTIRNLPDDLHAALKARAKRSRRSLNQQVIAELAIIEGMRKKVKGFMTADEIDQAKREGRA